MDRLLPTIIGLIVVLPLFVFWLWMFRDMTNNVYLPRWPFWDVTNYDNLPGRRFNWMLAFVFLNVFAAAIYYVTEYRNRH